MTVVEIIKELQNKVLEYKDENANLKMKIEELEKKIEELQKGKKPYVAPKVTILESGEIEIERKTDGGMDFFIPSADSDVDVKVEKPRRTRRKKNVE
jgi:hypothetical protein